MCFFLSICLNPNGQAKYSAKEMCHLKLHKNCFGQLHVLGSLKKIYPGIFEEELGLLIEQIAPFVDHI